MLLTSRLRNARLRPSRFHPKDRRKPVPLRVALGRQVDQDRTKTFRSAFRVKRKIQDEHPAAYLPGGKVARKAQAPPGFFFQ
jgi:hypothetical protein